MRSPESNWPAWVEKAEHDLLAIRSIMAGEEVPWDIVCFHAQQAAERLLKALLLFHGAQPSKTHDLMALLEECATEDQRVEELRTSCSLLNPYSTDIRYPEAFPEPDESEGRMAVEAARRIYSAICGWLPDQGESAQQNRQ